VSANLIDYLVQRVDPADVPRRRLP